MNAAIQYVKANAVLLALAAIALFQQSEIKGMERTLNSIYSVVQANEEKFRRPKKTSGPLAI